MDGRTETVCGCGMASGVEMGEGYSAAESGMDGFHIHDQKACMSSWSRLFPSTKSGGVENGFAFAFALAPWVYASQDTKRKAKKDVTSNSSSAMGNERSGS